MFRVGSQSVVLILLVCTIINLCGCDDIFNCSSIGGFLVNEKCYKFLIEGKTSKLNEARLECQKNFHPASEIGIITSQEEQDAVIEKLKNEPINEELFWLGFIREKISGDYVLGIDSKRYDYTNWADDIKFGCESSSRVYLSTISGNEMYKWVSSRNSEGYPFCEVDLSKNEILFPSVEDHYDWVDPDDEEFRGKERLVDEGRYIFQIGFNRCGTTSLHEFFGLNGIDSCHFKYFFGNLAATMYTNFLENRLLLSGISEHCDFLSDMEYFPGVHAYRKFFKLLDAQYPNSRFILNLRDKENWLRSQRRHMNGFYMNISAYYLNLTIDEATEVWSNRFDKHVEDVLEHFEGRPDKLFVFHIEDEDASSRLITFFEDWYPGLVEEYWGIYNSGDLKGDTKIKRYKPLEPKCESRKKVKEMEDRLKELKRLRGEKRKEDLERRKQMERMREMKKQKRKELEKKRERRKEMERMWKLESRNMDTIIDTDNEL